MTRFNGVAVPLTFSLRLISLLRSSQRGLLALLLPSLVFIFPVVAGAQDIAGNEEGIKPYGSYHGGNIDTISMANGNLTLNIPLISYPQRGGKVHLGFSLVYHNPVYVLNWNLETGGGCALECFTWGLTYKSGQASGGTEGTGSFGALVITPDFPAFNYWEPGYGIAAANAVWSPDGAVHQLSASAGGSRSIDTTGYLYSGSNILTDREGTQYTYATNSKEVPITLTEIRDANGNYITGNTDPNNSLSVLSWTDTLGRTIPNVSTAASTSGCPHPDSSVPPSSAVTWAFPLPTGNPTQTYLVCYAPFPLSYTPTPNCPYPAYSCYGIGGSTTQIQSIVLPNGKAWTFEFDTAGRLSTVSPPTGGSVSYTWQDESYCFKNGAGGNGLPIVEYQVTESALTRTVNANDGTGPHTWHYGYTYGSQTVVTDPYNNDTVHTLTNFGDEYGGLPSCSLYESERDDWSGSSTSGGTLLRKTVTSYQHSYDSHDNIAFNVEPTSITTTDVPAGLTSTVTKQWDSGITFTGIYASGPGTYGDLLSQSEYDFTGTNPVRTTTNTYMALSGSNASVYLNNNLLDLLSTVTVAGSSQAAYTTYGYDGSGTASSGVTMQKYRGWTNAGNQTSVLRWLNANTVGTPNCPANQSGYLLTSRLFYDTGEVSTSTDPCGHATTYLYANSGNGNAGSACSSMNYYGGYLTSVMNALNQTTYYCYDLNSGFVTQTTDLNLQNTNKTYDFMGRLTSVTLPDGGSATHCYTDAGGSTCSQASAPPYSVVTTSAITSSLNKVSTVVFDGFGRTSQTELNSDPIAPTYTLTTYDALGREYQVYNPTRCSAITSCPGETTWGVTTSNYDALGRVTSVIEQDGSKQSTTYDQLSSNGLYVCSTVTDEAGNSRQSCLDGLGRMTSVFEDPGSPPHSNYESDYTYDVLGNLLSVSQHGTDRRFPRPRTFQYDSLSHLTQAVNPESGTINYAYDADGNVVTKTAPSPNQPSTGTATVNTSYTYDKLNRLTIKSYADNYTQNPVTPTAQFAYDGSSLTGCTIAPPNDTDSYPIGRMTSMCDGSGGTSWIHDTVGRTHQESRAIGSASAQHYINYAYNLGGLVSLLQTPPMKQLNYSYGGDARPTQLSDSTDGINFVGGGTYAPAGELTGMTLGNTNSSPGITVNNAYNDRLQPLLMSAAVSGQSPVFSECFDFHLGVAVNTPPCSIAKSAGDNGNVYQVINNRASLRTQTFTYDALNRIVSAESNGTGSTSWGNTYVIDGWGNLTNMNQISGQAMGQNLQAAPATSLNRLPGYTYDAAGNMTVNGTATYVYDAENRLIATEGYSYIYDGSGQRVEKCTEGTTPGTCATGATGTLYWRGTGSDTLAETDLAGNDKEEYIFFGGQRVARRDTTSTGTTLAVHYYFSDHVGSHGVVTNATGTVLEQDIDYYPYGGEQWDYATAPVPQNYKFTGKERDAESGLDNFGARYNASSLGRFMTPDWAAKPVTVPYAKFGDPQSLNLYAMVENGPLNRIDPDGHMAAAWVLDHNIPVGGSTFYLPADMENSNDIQIMAPVGVMERGGPVSENTVVTAEGPAQNQSIGSVADSKVGTNAYLQSGSKGVYGCGTNKCNELVADSVQESGRPRPQVPKSGILGWLGFTRDPTANEWANPNVNIPGWSKPGPVSGAAPNDVIAEQHGAWGHAGVVVRTMDGSLATVSVNSTTNPAGMVTRNDWGFRPRGGNGEGPSDPAPVVRHYLSDLTP